VKTEIALGFGMSARRKPEFRVFTEDDVATLVKTLAALKNMSISELFNEALELWLSQPEQQKLIERHNLDAIEEDEG
jgi:predicted DNA-binding transcriptional regulator YafY